MSTPQPIPRRFRWLKRLTVLAVLGIVGFGLLYWWASRAVDNNLDTLIASVKAKGEPILPAEMNNASIPDDENAAVYLERAHALFPLFNGMPITDHWEDPPVVDDAKYLADAAPALAAMARARACEQAVWETEYENPYLNISRALGERRTLARLLADAAQRQIKLGRISEATERMRDILATSRFNETPPSSFITHLIAISIDGLAIQLLEGDLLNALQLPNEGKEKNTADANTTDAEKPGDANPQPAKREQINAIINTLLDDNAMRRGFHNAWIGERAGFLDIAQQLIDGELALWTSKPDVVDQVRLFFFRPIYKQQMIDDIERTTIHTDAAAIATTAPKYNAGAPASTDIYQPHWFNPIRVGMTSPEIFEAVSTTHFLVKTRMALAATALAIRLYELDHGQLPATLTALVPDYLAAVPVDPFDPKGGPVRYVPQGVTPTSITQVYINGRLSTNGDSTDDTDPSSPKNKKTPPHIIVYSVGPNAVDDGGAFELDAEENNKHPDLGHAREAGDVVFIIRTLPAPKK